MKQLGIKGNGHHTSAQPEPINEIVAVDLCPISSVDHPWHGLPEYLHNTYALELSVPLCHEDYHTPGALRREDDVPEGRLGKVNDSVPVPHVRFLIPRCFFHPPM